MSFVSAKISPVKTLLTLKFIQELTNGSSETTKVGRSQRMFLKTRRNPYKGFRSSRPEAFCEKRCS